MTAAKLTQKQFITQAGERAVIWINPANIAFHAGTKWPVGKRRLAELERKLPRALVNLARPAIKRREPFVIPADCFAELRAIVGSDRWEKIGDFVRNKDRITETLWYRALTEDLDRNGVAMHKKIAMRSRDEIEDFLIGYVRALVESLQTEGFKPDRDGDGYASTAVVNADGTLCKTGSGNHRFVMCKVMGIDRFPLKIVGAHEDWVRTRFGRLDVTTETLIPALAEIEARLGQ